MKKITDIVCVLSIILWGLLSLCALLAILWSSVSFADSITLDSTEPLAVPEGKRITDWEVTKINKDQKILQVKYVWRDTSDNIVVLGRTSWRTWTCQDIEVPGTNAECVAAADPYPCCTGAGTGTCDDMLDTCFTDVFGFQIRAQDVGAAIGIGLRDLIWNQMKQDVLTGGNDGTFD